VSLDDETDVSMNKKDQSEAIHNIFDQLLTEQTIRYIHASISFPTKRIWLKAIKKKMLLVIPW